MTHESTSQYDPPSCPCGPRRKRVDEVSGDDRHPNATELQRRGLAYPLFDRVQVVADVVRFDRFGKEQPRFDRDFKQGKCGHDDGNADPERDRVRKHGGEGDDAEAGYQVNETSHRGIS